MLFQLLAEPIMLHSGSETAWKIECDALDLGDIDCLAYLISLKLSPFSAVEGVPRGGTFPAEALAHHHLSGSGGLLIVDDVCTTGASLEAHRAGRDARGAVIFARGPCPTWVQPLFTYR